MHTEYKYIAQLMNNKAGTESSPVFKHSIITVLPLKPLNVSKLHFIHIEIGIISPALYIGLKWELH